MCNRVSIFRTVHVYGNVYMGVGVARALADPGLLGEQSSQKCESHCLGCQWTAVQNMTPVALSSAEKSDNHTNTQTVTDISAPCPSACVDKKCRATHMHTHQKTYRIANKSLPTSRFFCMTRRTVHSAQSQHAIANAIVATNNRHSLTYYIQNIQHTIDYCNSTPVCLPKSNNTIHSLNV